MTNKLTKLLNLWDNLKGVNYMDFEPFKRQNKRQECFSQAARCHMLECRDDRSAR